VERIGTRFGRKVHIDAGSASVLTGVPVADQGEFLNFVRTQHVVAGSRIVQVAVRIVHVAAVDCE
jgi:hypothetical protein